jgi:hypothetical protein
MGTSSLVGEREQGPRATIGLVTQRVKKTLYQYDHTILPRRPFFPNQIIGCR